ncbi:hypothetical protein PISL3812_01001 [Talaromyces islandicus]|uniref:PLAC8-domain-containing protein n=1 Tax=Talaromyces islandicus TaxID=28573 RepID=A0A0U1LMK1_TALIS|nr:hypothetical protein PISL3812_01001 [Talaromyces islandicus]
MEPKYSPPANAQYQTSEWAYSFWDCCTPFKTCFCASCCSCFLFGKTQARRRDPTLANYGRCNGDCMGWCALSFCGLQWILQTIKRSDMREELGIKGSGCGDCCAAYCCPCCALMQEEKEMVRRSETVTQAGYQPPEGMAYPPQQPPPY